MPANSLPNDTPNERFEVFFDGQCPLCKREIDMIRRKDKHERLLLTDIASPSFQTSDRSVNSLMRQIHGRYPNGEYLVGVDVFREIYLRIGFPGLVGVTRWPVVRQTLDLFYRGFAWLRFHHALRRMKRNECQDACPPDGIGVVDAVDRS